MAPLTMYALSLTVGRAIILAEFGMRQAASLPSRSNGPRYLAWLLKGNSCRGFTGTV